MVRNLLMFYTNNSLKPKDITERSSKSSPMNVLHICFRKVTTVTTVTLLAWAFITVRHWISHWAVIYLSAGVFMHTQKIYKYAKKTGKGVNVTCCCFLSFFLHSGPFCKTPLTCFLPKPRVGSSVIPQQDGSGPDLHLPLRVLRCIGGGPESAYISQQPRHQGGAVRYRHGLNQVGNEWGGIRGASGEHKQPMSGQREPLCKK